MRTITLALLSFAVTTQCQAADTRMSASPGETLANAYASEAKLPEAERFMGWFNGRCYFANETFPRAALLAGYSADNSQGPLFPGKQYFFQVIEPSDLGYSHALPSFFDRMTPEIRVGVKGFLETHEQAVPAEAVGQEFLRVPDSYRDSYTGIKEWDDYLLTQDRDRANEPWRNCYFFGEVH